MDPKPKIFIAQDAKPSRLPALLLLLLFLLLCGSAVAVFYLRTHPAAAAKTDDTQDAPVASNNTPAPALSASTETLTRTPQPATPQAEPPRVILAANFDTGPDGFVFLRDAFKKTAKPTYSEGTHVQKGGVSGGALSVHLGGRDNSTVVGMSGGWKISFTLPKPERLALTFAIKVTQSSEYEPDEFSQSMVMLDSTLLGVEGPDYLAQIRGDGNGGPEISTGWKNISLNLGEVPAGTHTLTFGAYNTRKSATNEVTDALIDDITLTTGASPVKTPQRLPSVTSQRPPPVTSKKEKYFQPPQPTESNLEF